MAFQDYFDLAPAYNPDTEQLVVDAAFQVFAVDDLSYETPLAATSADSGAALSPLVSNSIGLLPAFRVAGDPTQVILKSGSFTTRTSSRYAAVIEAGLDAATVEAAIAAGATAATAAGEAETARAAAVVAKNAAEAVPTTTDGLMAAVAGNPESEFAIAQKGTLAPIALGRSVTDFGVAVGATSAVNLAGFADAIEWAEVNAFGCRALYVPPVADPETHYEINDRIDVTVPGVSITGAGRFSRIKQTNKLKEIFRARGAGQRYAGLHLIGADSRTYVDGNGLDMYDDQHPFLHHVGVKFQGGSDGSIAEDLTGTNINVVVGVWAWDVDAAEYVANIDGLTIRSIRATNVWAAVFGREVDNLTVDDIAGSFSRVTGIGADPHLVYVTSSTYIVEKRRLFNVNFSNLRAFDSTGGEPVSMKYVTGGSISGLNIRGCQGVLVLANTEDVRVDPIIAIDVFKDVAIATPAMIFLSICKRTKIIRPYIVNRTGDQAKSIVVSSEVGSEDIEIIEPDITTDHATDDLAENRTEIYIDGLRGSVVRPKLKMLGGYRNAIKLAGTDCSVTDPECSGVAVVIRTDDSIGGVVYDYNPAKQSRADSSLSEILAATSAAELHESLTVPPAALIWDRGLIASPAGRVIRTSSGHAPNSTRTIGTWEKDAERWRYAVDGSSAPRYLPFDAGTPNVSVEADVWLGALNAGGSGTFTVGLVLRAAAWNINLLAEIRTDRVSLQYRNDATYTNVVSAPLATYYVGRKYRLRAVVFENRAQVFVDGVLLIDGTLDAGMMTALGTATYHGICARQSEASRWADLRITPLA